MAAGVGGATMCELYLRSGGGRKQRYDMGHGLTRKTRIFGSELSRRLLRRGFFSAKKNLRLLASICGRLSFLGGIFVCVFGVVVIVLRGAGGPGGRRRGSVAPDA